QHLHVLGVDSGTDHAGPGSGMALIGPPPPRGGRRTIGHARSAADQHRLLPWRAADQAALAGHADRGSATVDAELVVQVHQVGLTVDSEMNRRLATSRLVAPVARASRISLSRGDRALCGEVIRRTSLCCTSGDRMLRPAAASETASIRASVGESLST